MNRVLIYLVVFVFTFGLSVVGDVLISRAVSVSVPIPAYQCKREPCYQEIIVDRGVEPPSEISDLFKVDQTRDLPLWIKGVRELPNGGFNIEVENISSKMIVFGGFVLGNENGDTLSPVALGFGDWSKVQDQRLKHFGDRNYTVGLQPGERVAIRVSKTEAEVALRSTQHSTNPDFRKFSMQLVEVEFGDGSTWYRRGR